MKPRFQMVPPGPYYLLESIQGQVNKMYKKSMALILITLLAGSSAAGLSLVGAQTTDNSQQVAETMLNMLENSHEEMRMLFESTVAAGGTISEDAQTAFDEAGQLKTQAQEEYDLGEYEKAVKTATKAMNGYGKAAGKVFEENDEEELEDEEVEKNLGLFVAYEKSLERYEKLVEIAGELTAQEIDVTEVSGLLDEAQGKLEDMRTALDEGDFEAAEERLEEANSLLGQATGKLRSLSNQKKKEKTARFIDQTKNLVQNLEDKMLRILNKYDLAEEDAAAIQEQFQLMKAKLDGIDLDEDEDINDAIGELKDIVKESKNVGKDKDDLDDEVVESLKEINKQESKLERYRARIRELSGLGVDTAEMEALMARVETALMNAQSGAENEEDTENLIDEADELLDQLDDLIDDLEDETEDLEEDSEDDDESKDDDGKSKNKDEKGSEKNDSDDEDDSEDEDDDPEDDSEDDESDDDETS